MFQRQSAFAAVLVILVAAGTATTVTAALTPAEHPLFAGDTVQEIHLTFAEPSWYDTLRVRFETQEDPAGLPATLDWQDVHLEDVGVRFKGNSSYWGYPTDKKPFRLDLNEYVPGQSIDGLQDLSLSNIFKDPSYVREALFYELARAAGLAASRTSFAALYINGEYWGLYTLVERVDDEFVESRFGAGEDGNLFKADPHGTLVYQGTDPDAYRDDYELKTNEEVDDWSGLIALCDAVDNTLYDEMPTALSDILDVDSALAMLALNSLTANLDSYNGSGHNYYLYQRQVDGRFVCIPWDANEAWGLFTMGLTNDQLRTLPPRWLPYPPEDRPLAYHLWAPMLYETQYFGRLRGLLAGPADPDSLVVRLTAMRDLVAPWVAMETRAMFTYQEFQDAATLDVRGIPALEPFIRGRDTYLRSQLPPADLPALVLNELMADNEATVADEAGEYDDWLEILNTGDTAVSLGGLTLTDDSAYPARFVLPDTTLQPGERLLVWCDDDPEDGPLHTTFKLSAGGEEIGLFGRLEAGNEAIDTHVFGPQVTDVSEGRYPDGGDTWISFPEPTPGASNVGTTAAPSIPAAPSLAAYPNPFNPRTVMAFRLARSGHAVLDVYDARGRRVIRLLDGELPAGEHSLSWTGRDASGRAVAAGVYLARLDAAGQRVGLRLVLVR